MIEHLKADDLSLRVVATRNLPMIAEALGPERVRGELIPFVNDSTDDEDEVRSTTIRMYRNSTMCVVAQLWCKGNYRKGRKTGRNGCVSI